MFHPRLVTNPELRFQHYLQQGIIAYDDYIQSIVFHYDMKGLVNSNNSEKMKEFRKKSMSQS